MSWPWSSCFVHKFTFNTNKSTRSSWIQLLAPQNYGLLSSLWCFAAHVSFISRCVCCFLRWLESRTLVWVRRSVPASYWQTVRSALQRRSEITAKDRWGSSPFSYIKQTSSFAAGWIEGAQTSVINFAPFRSLTSRFLATSFSWPASHSQLPER